ncbi:NAD(P)/FAD-dependent oxidoreductase [Acinetobacter lactucae]|uniref:phytoene desaturase family protein n=1 Tax=Acinetobacter lactucae TaxID=1785128 RepID=UPI0021CD1A47|nr:NAD(P)/FAD-dependent oxidoreductase [Acinetobacter lactucae]MCU4347714.1 NAD(P)/FAD-dependent oxidoreductase [Acinetobacter lactucae]
MENLKTINKPWDVIVIGAGLGGLTASAYAAALGMKVLLLEQYSVLGGCSHVFRRKPNWEFDVGVHYIGDCGENGEIPNLLRGLGIDDKIEWLPLEPTGFDTIVGPDLELKVPVGWDNYLYNLIQAFPLEEKGIRRFISIVRKIGESLDIGRSAVSLAGNMKLFKDSGFAGPWMMAPLPSLFVACGLSPKLCSILSVQCGALATSSFVMPVCLYAGFLQHYVGRGGWYPKGGGQMLAAGFGEVILSHGGEIRTDVTVDRILIENGQVTGVRLSDGEVIHSSIVISNADIKKTYRDLVGYEYLPKKLVRRNENWKMSWPLINAFFGVEIDLSETPNSNYFAIPNWDSAKSYLSLMDINSRILTRAEKRSPIDWANDFAKNQAAYIQSSTRRDPSNIHSAPVGHSAIEVQTLAPFAPKLWGITEKQVLSGDYRDHASYQEIKEIVTDGLLQRVEQIYPGSAAKVKLRELGTPATQQRYTLSSGGAAYGIESRITQFGPFRPGTKTVIKGLYLAGCSTSTGAGTVGSMLSGMYAVGAILGRDLHAEVRAGKIFADKSLLSKWSSDFDPLKASIQMGRQSRKKDTSSVENEFVI